MEVFVTDKPRYICIGGPLDMRLLPPNDTGCFRYWSMKPAKLSAGIGQTMDTAARPVEYRMVTFCGQRIWVVSNYPLEMLMESLLRRLTMVAGSKEPLPTYNGLNGLQIARLVEHYEETTGLHALNI